MPHPAHQTIFVAGATGYVGQSIVELARGEGHTVVAHARPTSKQLQALRPRFESIGATIDSSPWQVEALSHAIAQYQPTLVFCVIGTTRKTAAREQVTGDIYERIDFALTKTLVQACTESHHSVRPYFVYLSSIGADVAAGSAYLRARGKAEQCIRESGLRHMIVRPSFITGDRNEARPVELASAKVGNAMLGFAAILGFSSLRDRYASLTGKQVAAGMLTLALRNSQAGEQETICDASDLRRCVST